MGFMGLLFAPFIIAGLLAVIGFIIAAIAILILLTLILTIIGLILRKKHRKASNVLLIIAAICFCLLITVLFILALFIF